MIDIPDQIHRMLHFPRNATLGKCNKLLAYRTNFFKFAKSNPLLHILQISLFARQTIEENVQKKVSKES